MRFLATLDRSPSIITSIQIRTLSSNVEAVISIAHSEQTIKMPQEACVQIKEELVACVIRSDWYVPPTHK
jgi:hypothetical protein